MRGRLEIENMFIHVMESLLDLDPTDRDPDGELFYEAAIKVTCQDALRWIREEGPYEHLHEMDTKPEKR